MAWNEPGGNPNDKDPWGDNGRRGDRQGPPDLDELLRKLMGRFSGGRRPRMPVDELPTGGGAGLVGILLAAVAAFWLYNAVYAVDEQEQAVILLSLIHI